MADSVEEQIVATENIDEQMVDTPLEEKMASEAPVEDQAVPDPPADHDSVVVVDENLPEHQNTVVEDLLEHHNVEDHNTVLETPLENHHIEEHNTVVETPLEHHHVEDHNAMVETPLEPHDVEDHNVMVETLLESEDIEDHNAEVITPIEHHHVEDQNLAEDHSMVVEHAAEEHHQMVSSEPDHHTAMNPTEHNVEEDHHMVSDLTEHHHVEDHHLHIAADPAEHHHHHHHHHQIVEEDHMVADLTDHHVDEHHLITVAHGAEDESVGGEQMESVHIIREDQMGSIHMEEDGQDQMAVTGDELAIMSTPENNHHHDLDQNHHEMSVFEEDKLLMTPYEAEPDATQPPSKRRKKKSIVWEYFTIETVSEGCRRACCKQCKQSFAYSTGSKVAGTSHLKRHIAKGTCQDRGLAPYTPATRGGASNGGSDPPRRRYRAGGAAAVVPFDADRCRHEVARMIIMHDYPLHLVEHPGFIAFVRNLQPQFQMVSFNTVQGDCVATYLMEKQNLMKLVDAIPGRVCLSLDMWTSSQSVGYVFVTGHFIDAEWKLQRRLLNVVMEPYPDSDTALGHAVAVCLHDWNLENRLFSITLSQQQREATLENLRPQLTVKNPLILGGHLVLGGCLARTFCAAAVDVLDEGKDVVTKVRESVKHVKTSESHDEKFSELKEQLRVPCERSFSVDDQTRWDTTYHMLAAACELKEVFSLLDTSDPDYKAAPTQDEWRRVETICSHLKLLHDSAAVLATPATNPTPITFFHEVWKIQSELTRAASASASDSDEFSLAVARRAKERVEQYWKENSLALAAAVVMDPRFKMKLVEFSFNKLYGDDAPAFIKVVDDGIHELFDEYVALPLPLTPTYAEDGSARSATAGQGGPAGLMTSDNGLTDFDVYIMETASQQTKSELDQYLDERLLSRVHDFDVLVWWRLNKPKYPTLSNMARDILSVAVSAVPPESVFATRPKEMDGYRSSLRPETVEALICTKDWMLHADASSENALLKIEY